MIMQIKNILTDDILHAFAEIKHQERNNTLFIQQHYFFKEKENRTFYYNRHIH